MPREYAVSSIALVCAAGLALAVAGCSNPVGSLLDKNEGGWFSKPMDVFAKPDWARPISDKGTELSPRAPVNPDSLIGADGRCVQPAAETAQASVPAPAAPEAPASPPAVADRPVGSMAGDLAGPPMPAGPVVVASAAASPPAVAEPSTPQVIGGIALGMTECQTVQRAGLPGNVAIGAGAKGERNVTLTYLNGTWPGIYHFADGRLKEIDRAPAPPAPPKAPPKKKIAKKPVKKPQT